MNVLFPNGVYPTMMAPYRDNGEIDFPGLEKLLDWYISHGCAGMFALCHSTEMHLLSMEERLRVVSFVCRHMDAHFKKTGIRIPVVAAGTFSNDAAEQAEEVCAISEAGADDVVWITNRLDPRQEGDGAFLARAEKLLQKIPSHIPLGFYECPQPYKRLLTREILRWALETDRFYFIKDTCCNPAMLRERIEQLSGSHLKLFNANAQTLLDTFRQGAAGYSSCMANVHPDLYAWLYHHHQTHPLLAQRLQELLTFTATFELYAYPVNAKYIMCKHEGVPIGISSRMRPTEDFDDYNRVIADQLYQLTTHIRQILADADEMEKQLLQKQQL